MREARENKGLTLEEVQAETRIHARFLTALEKGDYAALPTPVHVRGFLRNYARFLGLDPQPLLARYQNNHGYSSNGINHGQTNGSFVPTRDDQPFFDPVNVEVESISNRRSPESALQLVIIAALLLALALIGMRFIPILLGNGDGTETITAEITQALQEMTNNGELEPTIDINATLTATDFITSTSRNNTNGAASGSLLATPSPTRPPLPAILDTIQLRLDITERTWMEVTIDGDVVFTGIARTNDVFEWEAQNEVKLLTGNAIGIVATINEVQLGRLGGRGENREEVWRTTQ
ncbi:MAG: helix-turn-helix domain-containing protein [Anaerolineales bacterium]|nr:helix-turn-helix domain-containing protein [Anaerolineales bacterium]